MPIFAQYKIPNPSLMFSSSSYTLSCSLRLHDLKSEASPVFNQAMALVLHAGKTNKNASKALIAAEYSGVEVKLVENFEMGVSNKTPEFLKMNPIGKVPVLETPEGPIFESNAMLSADSISYIFFLLMFVYLSGHIKQWIDFASMEIDANIAKWFYPRRFGGYLPPAEEFAIASLKRALGALNTRLASNA
ncbi:hypothetical protein CRYUN_Cryun10bG0165800 [Craigia yunnanensis]